MTVPMSATSAAGQRTSDGLAPRGMLWVAWRQRRSLVLITLGLYATAAATIIVRSVLRARDLASAGVSDLAGCSDPAMTTTVLVSCERWLATSDSWSGAEGQLGNVPTVICALFGLGLGAAVIGHEFERNQGAFSFTQAVSPIFWAATQLAVVVTATVPAVVALEVVIRVSADANLLGDPDSGVDPSGLWLRPVLLVGMICLGFVLSIVSRSSAGGFWGGLGVLTVGGMVVNFLSRSTVTSQSYTVACPNQDPELCGRITTVVFRFRALSADTAAGGTAVWVITLVVGAAIALAAGFLLLRRRFR